MMIWSRDLDYGHNFVREGGKIWCTRCGLSPYKMFDTGLRTKIGRFYKPHIETINLRRSLSPHRAKFLVRHMQMLVGNCVEEIVRYVTES